MALRTICVYPDPVLREETESVTEFDEELKTLVGDMFDTMYEANGVGLAAPQVGILKRIGGSREEDRRHRLPRR